MSDSKKNGDPPDRGKGQEGGHGSPPHFQVRIDREHYTVTEATLTGLQLRALSDPDIGSDRDLFEVVPGGSDIKIENETAVVMRSGLRFFTAPAQINPGQ